MCSTTEELQTSAEDFFTGHHRLKIALKPQDKNSWHREKFALVEDVLCRHQLACLLINLLLKPGIQQLQASKFAWDFRNCRKVHHASTTNQQRYR
eukprot:m.75545 g.75545  ORF g.75545 m.75545 type:complete len:95 (-) comp16174_c0_seq1:993-1277(-)